MSCKVKIFNVSALPVWSMSGKGGMPSLRETLDGQQRAGFEICLLLPKYDLFSDDCTPLTVVEQSGISVFVAQCRWLPLLKKVRARTKNLSGNGQMPFVLRWILNVSMYLLLTLSFYLAARQSSHGGSPPHLVYAHNQYAALSGYLLGRRWKVANVTRLYGTFLADLMSRPLVSLRYPTAAAGYLIPSTLLICANDGTRGNEVAQKFGVPDDRFRFWQNGVDPPSEPPQVDRDELARKNPGLRKNSKWLVSCSRLSYWKRIDRMLNALSHSRAAGVDCQLIVAGDGTEKDRLCKLSETLGVEDHVVWLGAVAHDDIWALMNNADVFMITNDVTNRCNPLYEAAWAGLPVVSIKDPSTADLLKHDVNALLAERDDCVALGRLLVDLCKDSALSHRLSVAQKQLAESFWTWEERLKVETDELETLMRTSSLEEGGE